MEIINQKLSILMYLIRRQDTLSLYFSDEPKTDIYTPDRIPPNWAYAESHCLANKVGFEVDKDPKKIAKLCNCCGR